MKILVYANCQTNQLVTTLQFSLIGRASAIAAVDANNPESAQQLQKAAEEQIFDLVITNLATAESERFFDRNTIVAIPDIHFGGFHPDVVYFSLKSNPTQPQFFMKNPTISAIALWGHLKNLGPKEIAQLYTEQVFDELGYMDYFDVSCAALLKSFENAAINPRFLDRHISSREVFMYGPLHPKLEVTMSLCFGLLEKLGIAPSQSYDSLYKMMPDPLQPEYAWGCFPPLAARLGVPGSWFIRHWNHVFPTIEHYLQGLLNHLNTSYPEGSLQMFERDKLRFDNFHKVDNVLGTYL